MSCAGIDYISYTASGPAARIEYAAACNWMAGLSESGDMQQRTRHGYVGRVYGGAFAGLRGDDEAWVSVSGHRAHAYLQERMQTMDRHARARRIDIQITYPVAGSAEGVDDLIRNVARELAATDGRRAMRVIDTYGRGSTLYYGSESARSRVVLYNKGAESGYEAFSGWLRVEARYYRDLAERAFESECGAGIRRYRCCAPRLRAILRSGGLRTMCLRRMAICPLTGCGRKRADRIARWRARSCGLSGTKRRVRVSFSEYPTDAHSDSGIPAHARDRNRID
jgi:hypothetical protein